MFRQVLASGSGSWDGTVVNPSNPQRRDTHLLVAGGYLVCLHKPTLSFNTQWPFANSVISRSFNGRQTILGLGLCTATLHGIYRVASMPSSWNDQPISRIFLSLPHPSRFAGIGHRIQGLTSLMRLILAFSNRFRVINSISWVISGWRKDFGIAQL